MNKHTIVKVLSGIFHCGIEPDGVSIKKADNNLMYDSEEAYYHFIVENEGDIIIEHHRPESLSDGEKPVHRSLRSILWKVCELSNASEQSNEIYETWKKANNGVGYIQTKITRDADEESADETWRSIDFIQNILNKSTERENLRLILAEYGMGKTSFCRAVRSSLVNNNSKDRFLEGKSPFIFVFDLNEFQDGSFSKFIQNELTDKYAISMTYETFVLLCQMGYFIVLLDAWDQMRDPGKKNAEVDRHLQEMSRLWKENGEVIITCRRSFYQQQLKHNTDFSKIANLYSLRGFDKESLISYLEESGNYSLDGLSVGEWTETVWRVNSALFYKPINVKLFAKNVEIISTTLDFMRNPITTVQLFNEIYEKWQYQNRVYDSSFLKLLVFESLRYGQNRSIRLSGYIENLPNTYSEKDVLEWLDKLDFVDVDEQNDRIEFVLAAYQEFFWAKFAYEELKTRPSELDPGWALIKNYLLLPEAREWICNFIRENKPYENKEFIETEAFIDHLRFLRYKHFVDVKYQGANALTLICDLHRIDYYKEQFEKAKKDFRDYPLCGTDFRSMDLSDADFSGSNLDSADFSYTNLTNTNFRGANLANTRWNEYGEMKKCAFLQQDNGLTVATATDNGVLTYAVRDEEKTQFRFINNEHEIIKDLAGNRSGIYTAASDGWVGFIDGNGDLKNAYIDNYGLQSITASDGKNSDIYVGAKGGKIYKYSWKRTEMSLISICGLDETEEAHIADIHYHVDGDDEYIAYTVEEGNILRLLRIDDNDSASLLGTAKLGNIRNEFGDICFTDDKLVYSILGHGVFAIPVNRFFNNYYDDELLQNSNILYENKEADRFVLSWASEAKSLYIISLQKNKRIDNVTRIYLENDNSFEKTHIDAIWYFTKNYSDRAFGEYKGFSVSDDGEHFALSGNQLVVFDLLGDCYELHDHPVESRILREGVNIDDCTGMDENTKKFFE